MGSTLDKTAAGELAALVLGFRSFAGVRQKKAPTNRALILRTLTERIPNSKK